MNIRKAIILLSLMLVGVGVYGIVSAVWQDHIDRVATAQLEAQAQAIVPVEQSDKAAEEALQRVTTTTTTTSTTVPASSSLPSTTSVAPSTTSATATTTTTTTTTTTATLPSPPAAYPAPDDYLGRVYIERLGMRDGELYMGDRATASTPDHGELRAYDGYNLPGQGGTVGIGGHRTSATAPFHDLLSMQLGDTVVIVTEWGVTYSYAVNSVDVVPEPGFTAHIDFVHANYEGEHVVLYSCGDASGNAGGTASRVMVTAALIDAFVAPGG